jgi:cobyrinic acid a,c-diamide synthase
VVDATKSTRTIAAVVLGCLRFDPDVDVAGVVLNRMAGPRHETVARKAVERYCDVPVLGAIPKIKEEIFPERHMGLVPTPEHGWATDSIDRAAEIAEECLDLERLAVLAGGAPDLQLSHGDPASGTEINAGQSAVPVSEAGSGTRTGEAGKTALLRPRIGVIQDAAFQFYYPENIHALVEAGADIVVLSALRDQKLDGVDGVYIGGGFPETQAEGLSGNVSFRGELRDLARAGLPVYAECGGLMYLGEKLVLAGEAYPMVGLLPVVFGFSRRPQGHGYTICEVDGENPYFPVGSRIRGHEFHYSTVLSWGGEPEALVFRMVRGQGIEQFRDGICYANTLATYVHIHALGTPSWAQALVGLAVAWRQAASHGPDGKNTD